MVGSIKTSSGLPSLFKTIDLIFSFLVSSFRLTTSDWSKYSFKSGIISFLFCFFALISKTVDSIATNLSGVAGCDAAWFFLMDPGYSEAKLLQK